MLRSVYLLIISLALCMAVALPPSEASSGIVKRQTSREEIIRRNELRASRTQMRRADSSSVVSCGQYSVGKQFILKVSDGTYITGGSRVLNLDSGASLAGATVFVFDSSCNIIESSTSVPATILVDNAVSGYIQFGYPITASNSALKCTVGAQSELTCVRAVNPQPVSQFGTTYNVLKLGGQMQGETIVSLPIHPITSSAHAVYPRLSTVNADIIPAVTTVSTTMHLLAINCGSSSIKGKLYSIGNSSAPLKIAATLSVSGISSKGEKIKIKVKWTGEKGDNVNEEGEDGGTVEYKSLVPLLLDRLTESGGVDKEDVKYITHRVVHGGTHKEGIVITRDHDEGLGEMDKLSAFAPLHNHHAVLAVRACLDALPHHTSILLFDTLFHQTIPPETYTYALPPSETDSTMQIRKYGFHGLSYASIVTSLAKHLRKEESEINIVVAHLGSGASSCCIRNGKSIDTSMGLTPLEGLIGGTRSGTIDPTAIFHLINNPAGNAGLKDMDITKSELVLNKQSGLQALAGTTNFGKILSHLDPSSCSEEENKKATLAYGVYMDRLLSYISQYLFKLLSTTSIEKIDGIVFSGGIGEKGVQLRRDVLGKFEWLGAVVNDQANEKNEGEVREITAEGSKLKGWVVETDEEKHCAELARRQLGF